MNKRIIRSSVITIIVFTSLHLSFRTYAQETHGNPQFWYLLLTNHDINDKWSVGNELHMRYDDWHNDKTTFIIRPYLNYKLVDGAIATVGYSLVQSFPYGFYPAPDNVTEHNVWEQITLNKDYGKVSVSHRYRWEHRFVERLSVLNDGSVESDGTDYSNRFRYRITARVPLTDKYFINAFDELWVKSDDRLVSTQFDRNWLYLALGYKVSDKLNFQLAYLHQYAINNPDRYERHSGIQVMADLKF